MITTDLIENDDFFNFIEKHLGEQPDRLMLRHGADSEFPWAACAVTQIECRRKYAVKFSDFLGERRFLFADRLSAEQATDCAVARYHASLIKSESKILDMTAGLGIDAMTIARAGNYVTAAELDDSKALALTHNARCLNIKEFSVVKGDSVEFLKSSADLYDYIFIDPARRDSSGGRTYSFTDCQPDLNAIYPLLLSRCRRLIVKASPMLDVSYLISAFPHIREIHIVALNGECKEVLLCAENGYKGVCLLRCVNLRRNSASGSFTIPADSLGNAGAPITEQSDLCAGAYLYVPDATVMKLPCSGYLCSRFAGMKKLSSGTSVFVSAKKYVDFPGRCFQIERSADSKTLKQMRNTRRSVISRNYPESAEAIMKRYRLQSSETDYLIAARAGTSARPTLLLAQKA